MHDQDVLSDAKAEKQKHLTSDVNNRCNKPSAIVANKRSKNVIDNSISDISYVNDDK